MRDYLNQEKNIENGFKRVHTANGNSYSKVDGVLIKVNLAYSSVSAGIIAKDLGLDIRTTSAYIIALRGLRKMQKATK